MTNEVIIRC